MITTVVVLVLITGAAVWIYNRLVADRNQVRNAWSDIDVQLARRHDLVPQLVNAVKGYADYEQATMVAVTALRDRSAHARRLADKAALEDAMETGLHHLIAVQEDYPDLKADENFRALQTSLTEVEDHLQYARRFYNGSVRLLNTRIESFPHLLLAGPLGFKPAEFFEADERARANVEVKLV